MPSADGVEHRFIDIGGARMHVAEAGAGPPLVLLHGWPQHWFSWRHVLPTLEQHHRVICPDIRGLGWSEGPGTDWSFRRLAGDVLELVDHYGIDQVSLIGHDWGGAIGYQLCLDYPDRVQRFMPLAAVHPWSWIGATPRLVLRPWHIYIGAAAASIATGRLRVPEIALRSWRHNGAFTAAEAEIYVAPLRLPRGTAATRHYYRNVVLREMPRFLREGRGLRLRVPTLHLQGAQDPLTQAVPDSWQTFADDMRLERLEDCGHFVAEEQAEALAERVLAFFAGAQP